jgi:hypothetical protein
LLRSRWPRSKAALQQVRSKWCNGVMLQYRWWQHQGDFKESWMAKQNSCSSIQETCWVITETL